LTTKLVKGF